MQNMVYIRSFQFRSNVAILHDYDSTNFTDSDMITPHQLSYQGVVSREQHWIWIHCSCPTCTVEADEQICREGKSCEGRVLCI